MLEERRGRATELTMWTLGLTMVLTSAAWGMPTEEETGGARVPS